jgi:hypothetical protein
MEKLSSAIRFGSLFKEDRTRLGLPYLNLSIEGQPLEYDHPSLFELQAVISTSDSALLSSWAKFSRPFLPKLPDFANEELPIVSTVLEGILDVYLDLPVKLDNEHYFFSADELMDPLSQILVDWLQASLPFLQSAEAFDNGHIPPNYLLQLIRALGYIYSIGKQDLLVAGFYQSFHYCLWAHGIARYSHGVIRQIAEEMIKQTSQRALAIKGLANALLALVNAWNQFILSAFPKALQVCFNYDTRFCLIN